MCPCRPCSRDARRGIRDGASHSSLVTASIRTRLRAHSVPLSRVLLGTHRRGCLPAAYFCPLRCRPDLHVHTCLPAAVPATGCSPDRLRGVPLALFPRCSPLRSAWHHPFHPSCAPWCGVALWDRPCPPRVSYPRAAPRDAQSPHGMPCTRYAEGVRRHQRSAARSVPVRMQDVAGWYDAAVRAVLFHARYVRAAAPAVPRVVGWRALTVPPSETLRAVSLPMAVVSLQCGVG